MTLVTNARATTLFMDDATAAGVGIARRGGTETIGCRSLVLACNGFGADPSLVARHIPALADALWFGHAGNDGLALGWGEAIGADVGDLGGHQGHGSVAHPHGILITWATMAAGGFQVDASGRRFSNESEGYSEQAERVLARPGGVAWSIFDARIAAIARQFDDFRKAEAAGAVLTASTPEELAEAAGLPARAFAQTMAQVRRLAAVGDRDGFDRHWDDAALAPPYHAVKVTGALFHTQGGLLTDETGRVLRNGAPLENLFAAGGAAIGVSGPTADGYLSGNGLLTAVAMGNIAGRSAARHHAARTALT